VMAMHPKSDIDAQQIEYEWIQAAFDWLAPCSGSTAGVMKI
jgi:hypothetical protein